jgi:hypothetical protein
MTPTPRISIDGVVPYVHTKIAAKNVGVTPDYISKLARWGRIRGKLIGRAWHVSEPSLKAYLATQHLQRQAWKKKLAKLRTQEQIAAGFAATVKRSRH